MKYFDKDFLDFFKELAANNNKDWMDANKKRYLKSVKDPFKKLVEDLIVAIGEIDPKVARLEAKNAIFRINRDIRFSKDKTPYKTQVSAVISPTGKKPMSLPGIYIQLSPEDLRIYGGVYQLDTKTLKSVRTEIMDNEKKFLKLISDKIFRAYYGEIQGKQNKRIDKEFMDSAERIPLMYNKNFYYFKTFPASDILKTNLIETMVDGYKIGRDLGLFFNKPMSI